MGYTKGNTVLLWLCLLSFQSFLLSLHSTRGCRQQGLSISTKAFIEFDFHRVTFHLKCSICHFVYCPCFATTYCEWKYALGGAKRFLCSQLTFTDTCCLVVLCSCQNCSHSYSGLAFLFFFTNFYDDLIFTSMSMILVFFTYKHKSFFFTMFILWIWAFPGNCLSVAANSTCLRFLSFSLWIDGLSYSSIFTSLMMHSHIVYLNSNDHSEERKNQEVAFTVQYFGVCKCILIFLSVLFIFVHVFKLFKWNWSHSENFISRFLLNTLPLLMNSHRSSNHSSFFLMNSFLLLPTKWEPCLMNYNLCMAAMTSIWRI